MKTKSLPKLNPQSGCFIASQISLAKRHLADAIAEMEVNHLDDVPTLTWLMSENIWRDLDLLETTFRHEFDKKSRKLYSR